LTRAPATRLVPLTPDQLRDRLSEALRLYVTAMRYPSSTAVQRAPMWLEHILRPGWRCMAAFEEDDTLVGIAYGYLGAAGQWWHEQVRKGLVTTMAYEDARAWLADYFELTELHVRPDAQGRGLGEQLLRMLLSNPTPAGRVLLSTPEGPSRAWQLYMRVGFEALLRNYRFAGDPREFAVLGRALPL
jgi:ribosomal protein S18 acetylase RimI-like enzyme